MALSFSHMFSQKGVKISFLAECLLCKVTVESREDLGMVCAL